MSQDWITEQRRRLREEERRAGRRRRRLTAIVAAWLAAIGSVLVLITWLMAWVMD